MNQKLFYSLCLLAIPATFPAEAIAQNRPSPPVCETCFTDGRAPGEWSPMPGIVSDNRKYNSGVSAMYAGRIKRRIVVAGGANFPDTPAADGGRKVFYQEMYMLHKGRWRQAGKLPCKAAYGVTFPVNGKLVFAGGCNENGALKEVWQVRLRGNQIAVSPIRSLPYAIEQATGAAIGTKLYLYGGLADGSSSSRLLMLDTGGKNAAWKELKPAPEALVQAVMVAADGKLHLWGGFDPSTGEVSDRGYSYDPETDRWHETEGTPDGGTFTGACSANLSKDRIVIAGGVDRTIFSHALQLPKDKMREYLLQPVENYRFRQEYGFLTLSITTGHCTAPPLNRRGQAPPSSPPAKASFSWEGKSNRGSEPRKSFAPST